MADEQNFETAPAEEPQKPNPSWERVQLARHPKRPHSRDYIEGLITAFEEIHGDRFFGDDKSVLAGMGFFEGKPVMLVSQQKGRDTKEKLMRNFGMPKPEGYRKALRVMRLAAKFRLPIITLIDTPGAYPGIDAEERGQAEAIAYNLREMTKLKVPVIVGPIYEAPKDDERYDTIYSLPAQLYKRGVKVVFASYSAHNVRNLPDAAGFATAFGLPYDEALKAITINAAEVWGVADQLGSLDVGKIANVVVANGDPLDVKTDVKQVYIQGQAIPMTDRQVLLRDEYSK